MFQGRLLADDTTPVGTFAPMGSDLQLSFCNPPEVSSREEGALASRDLMRNYQL